MVLLRACHFIICIKAKAEINKDYVRYSSKKDAELKNKVRGNIISMV